MVITVFDAMGIQEYLFGSNRLAENIGASYLVEQALNDWPLESAIEVFPGRVNPPVKYTPAARPGIFEQGPFDIELLYSAGGNAIFACKDIEKAREFAGAYSRKLHERAPGLDVACHHLINEEENGFNLGEVMWDALSGMSKQKNYRFSDAPLTGMGVTERCASGNDETAITGYPPAEPDRFLGPSAWAKIQNSDLSRTHLNTFLRQGIPGDFELPSELDRLGRSTGEKSFVGICHIDGNGVGKSLQNLLWSQTNTDPDAQLSDIRNFSANITNAGAQAVRAVMEQVMRNWDPTEQKYAGRLDLYVDCQTHKLSLPFRPLVYGGDDITFVCDGRIALDLAATCLKVFNAAGGLYACAGIALVKSHYPFFRAYSLAEELCRNAKKMVKSNFADGASAMDWQIVSGGPLRSLDSWREREYVTGGNQLTCRPYVVLPSNATTGLKNWDSFRNDLLLCLQGENPAPECSKWKQAHSRLKSLTPHLRSGPEITQQIFKEWEQKGHEMPAQYNGCNISTGFYDTRTPFLDALELLDFFVPLKSENGDDHEPLDSDRTAE